MRARPMTVRALSVALAAALGLSACTGSERASEPSPTDSATSPGLVAATAVPTNSFRPGMPWPTALARGTLKVVLRGADRCFVLEDRGRVTEVTWPAGFSARWGSPTTLIDPAGRVVASEGERLFVGGGYVGQPSPCARARSTFSAGPIEVNGVLRYGTRSEQLPSSSR